MDLAGVTLAALLVVVVASCVSRANPGVVALALVGVVVGVSPWFGDPIPVRDAIEGFPAEMFLTLLGVSVLFTQAEVNGTLSLVAAGALTACRGNAGLLPVAFFVLAFALGSAGPGNIAVAGLVAPVAMAAAQRAGIPPLLMALAVGHGAVASTLSPITAAGVVADRVLNGLGLSGAGWTMFTANAVANVSAALAGYLVFGGWRFLRERDAARSGRAREQGSRGAGEQGREGDKHRGPLIHRFARTDGSPLLPCSPAPLLRHSMRHGLTLLVLAIVVLAVAAGNAHLGLTAFAAAAVLAVAGLTDERETFAQLPWGVLVMVAGVSTLTALLDRTGGTKRFADLITTVSTPRTAPALVAFVVGVVSIYSSTTGVVLPAFLPMVKHLADSQPGADPMSLALAVVVGGTVVDVSPLSTIGALCVAGSPPEVDRRILFRHLTLWGFAMAVAAAIGCGVVL